MKKLTSKLLTGLLTAGLTLNILGSGVAHAEFSEEIAMNMGKASAGASHSLIIDADGNVWAWGSTSNGALGVGDTGREKYKLPTKIEDFSDVRAVSAANVSSIALKNDGTVWAWGVNIGDGKRYSESDVPVQVKGLENVVAVSAGNSHNMVLKDDGTVWAWGSNRVGNVGNGTKKDVYAPVQVSKLSDVKAIATGFQHSLALKNDGTVWAWGGNRNGQLGNGFNEDKTTPVRVVGLEDVVSIAAGDYHSVALKSDGTVWTWGSNGYGELGNGRPGLGESESGDLNKPTQVPNLDHVDAIAETNGFWTTVLKDDGTVWGWGRNYEDLIFGDTRGKITTPHQIPEVNDAVAVSSGTQHSLVMKNDGTVWAWGNNYGNKLLGNEDIEHKSGPVEVFFE
ncbi:RCC1 repeat- and reductase domain-containing protein [Brevibacillus formosus]|uniref:RCC1 domain-containing protein n=1 Tax=Brevibacillus TaxID=55080 RepID=UPI001304FFBC|nr:MULTISPECIES: RCC1 domain-containing protein [Brevibacillus]MED1945309.1 RCC1 repeat- and reductase domain-containing protein [Brevibacillus formosus]MED1998568.1 RCC1 repeat- and reductase domain-containing protein [Brevibacillus formosus]MED2083537.1 RCC1 repeat- and reductase domain-containing protein [Brevibacillus formosus]